MGVCYVKTLVVLAAVALLSLPVPAHGVHSPGRMSGRSMSRENFLSDAVKDFKPPSGLGRADAKDKKNTKDTKDTQDDVESLMEAASSTRVVQTRWDHPVRARHHSVPDRQSKTTQFILMHRNPSGSSSVLLHPTPLYILVHSARFCAHPTPRLCSASLREKNPRVF